MNGNVYRDGQVFVCNQKCSTCIFRRGNPMNLEPGRKDEMVKAALADDSAIICHQSIVADHDLVCRGFYDRHKTTPLKLARALGAITFETPPKDNADAIEAVRESWGRQPQGQRG